MTPRLEGKVAFITGAARGQGRSHAVRLAEEGADIIAIDLCQQVDSVGYSMSTTAEFDETKKLVDALGRRVVASQADVRDHAALKAVVDDGVAQLGRLDLVAANAGICSFAPAMEMSEETWQDMIDINLTGVWNTVRATVPHLIAGGRGGSIVITSSALGIKGKRNTVHYTSAKHGVVGMMKTLAIELGEYAIRVNSVHPTGVDTPMIQNSEFYRLFRPDLDNPTREDVMDRCAEANVMGIPWVEPVDISNALLFLMSDEARYITGVQLPVDAGLVIK